jgi:hypothetical protein
MDCGVLPVANVPFDEDKARVGDLDDMSAEEWMSYVRYEAAQLPSVSRADMDPRHCVGKQTPYMPVIEAVSQCHPDALASREWEEAVLKNFACLIANIEEMSALATYQERRVAVPPMKDQHSWHIFSFGPEATKEAEKEERGSGTHLDMDIEGVAVGDNPTSKLKGGVKEGADTPDDLAALLQQRREQLSTAIPLTLSAAPAASVLAAAAASSSSSSSSSSSCRVQQGSTHAACPTVDLSVPHSPSLRLVLQFDQCMCQTLLRHHVGWLQTRALSKERAAWLYALLARLEEPLHQDTEASIRSLYRRCCHLRAMSFPPSSSFLLLPAEFTATATGRGMGALAVEAGGLAALNLIVAICGDHFRQGEAYVKNQEEAGEAGEAGEAEAEADIDAEAEAGMDVEGANASR